MHDKRWKDGTAAVASVIAIIIVAFLLPPGLQLILHFCELFAFLFHAYLLGRRLIDDEHWITTTLLAGISLLAIQACLQTLWFYSGKMLGSSSDLWTLVGTLGFSSLLIFLLPERKSSESTIGNSWPRQRQLFAGILAVCSIASFGLMILAASRAGTVYSIRTPWPLLPPGVLAVIGCAWLALFLSVWIVRSRWLAALQGALAISATTLIAPLVYRLGFGFDGFLHIATERLILTTGTLHPKPLYYIGQYVFTTWLARTLDMPIETIDRWLVPLGAAVLLPVALCIASKTHRVAHTLFLLPLAPFVATTPQSFAYLLGLSGLILAHLATPRLTPMVPLLLSIWASAVHPLAGIPFLLITSALVLVSPDHPRLSRNMLAGIIAGIGTLSVPILFFLLSLKGSTPISWDTSKIFHADPWIAFAHALLPWIGNHFVIWPAWSSLVLKAIPCLLLAGGIHVLRLTDNNRLRTALLLGSGALFFGLSTALKTAGDFAFLIDYERGNYADRLFLLGIFCFFTAAIPGIRSVFESARRAHPLLHTSFLVVCVSLATALSTNALPRHDALVTGRGWSVGRADIEAVRAIDQDANGEPYTVLANQSVSAAAVSQFGFKRYHEEVFFYPIPTGGPLYELFLQATYQEPTLDTMKEAGKRGGSTLVYVVLNDYWWNAEQVAESMSTIANTEYLFGHPEQGEGHAVHVYKFDLRSPRNADTTVSGS